MNNEVPAFISGIMIGFFIALFLIYKTYKAEDVVKEYIQHPEMYKVEYVTYQGDTTDIRVTLLK